MSYKQIHQIAGLALMLCLPFLLGAQAPAGQLPVYVIKNVQVITMDTPNLVRKHVNVTIRDHRIAAISDTLPEGITTIDGAGKWLIPGLIDMHVHLPADLYTGKSLPIQAPDVVFDVQDIMIPFVINGVTTIFNLNAVMASFCQKNEVDKGRVIGPQMALAALIDGGTGSGRTAHTPVEGRQAVRDAKAEGYAFIKPYSQLDTATYMAIIDEAYIQGMKTVGHIPTAFQHHLDRAFVPHFGMVAHAEELSKYAVDFSEQEAKAFARLAKARGTWLTPTLTAMVWIALQTRSLAPLQAAATLRYVHPLLQSKWLTTNNYQKHSSPEQIAYFDKMVAFNRLLVGACKEAGVPIVAGTDVGVSGVVVGFSLHDELELLVDAGLTPEEALNAATRLPATWLGINGETGTIAPGKRADLMLLDENPLEDITRFRHISAVCVNGRWLAKDTLAHMRDDLAARNEAAKSHFDWKTMMRPKE